jgi:hypothetical protein
MCIAEIQDDFDLHTKLNGEYGFTGAKRLYNIFGL